MLGLQSAGKSELRITSWYINSHRVMELLTPFGPSPGFESRLHQTGLKGELLAEASYLMTQWLRKSGVQPLELLVNRKEVKRGKMFTYDGRFFSRGLAGDKRGKMLVHLRLPLRELGEDKRTLLLEFHSDGLTTSTARGRLMGQPSVFTVAHVQSITGDTVVARPYIIGDLVEDFGGPSGMQLRRRELLQIPLFGFDQFSKIDFTRRVSASQLNKLKSIPEKKVKEVFAEAVNELWIGKDWGGEECDLFTENLIVEGTKRTGAFMFKGPSKFHPMQMTDCGKNGDQIVRLFDVGADVSILQHCHTVTASVRKTMAAFAGNDFGRLRRYAIFDGYATFLVLSHFGAL